MRYKLIKLKPFARSMQSLSKCYRAESEEDLAKIMPKHPLARGAGLSYNDSNLLNDGPVLDCQRLTQLLRFDEQTGIVHCQAGVPLRDLLHVHPDYILPVIPGSIHITVGGAIAHDVHGKNNAQEKTFAQHLQSLVLQTDAGEILLSPQKNNALFEATIGGLGLTGTIKSAVLALKKAPKMVEVHCQKHQDIAELLKALKEKSLQADYQVAWMDLLSSSFRGILQWANASDSPLLPEKTIIRLPKQPFRLITRYTSKMINHFYFHHANEAPKCIPLTQFNNPLDRIQHWNYLYGKKGFIQFQACIPETDALQHIRQIIDTIRQANVVPTLCVLKYFQHPGQGMLSFVRKGYALAIDFICSAKAQAIISELNALISTIGGRVYLAKDQMLTAKEFARQYPEAEHFIDVLQRHHCKIRSDLSQRVGITP